MRRVYGIYLVRQITKPATRLAVFLGVSLVITSSVSLPNIIHNALQSSDLVRFFIAAVSGTTLVVQLGVLLAGLLLVWTIVDAFRTPSHARFSA